MEVQLADLGLDPSTMVPRNRMPALTVVEGRAFGRVFRLEHTEILIGRADDATICVQEEGVSRRHARISVEGGRHVLSDLGSKNGTRVNGQRITGPVALAEGDSIRIGPHTVLRFGARDEVEEQVQERLYDLATRDPLTHALNRRAFDERLASEWAWARRHGRALAICAIDADHFKSINDRWGHAAGDFVLQRLCAIVKDMLRKEDVFARVGGEEFAVLARATTREAALALAERARSAIERHSFEFEGVRLPVTVSVGVATSLDGTVGSAAELVALADAALYRAKSAGRNRVALADVPGGPPPVGSAGR